MLNDKFQKQYEAFGYDKYQRIPVIKIGTNEAK